ncbi:MAG TPA: hypothetical protein PL033_07395 [Candidatus Brocadiia bacterium]|nr:hypothetical protein [Candidatus Brocadiia bacterium]
MSSGGKTTGRTAGELPPGFNWNLSVFVVFAFFAGGATALTGNAVVTTLLDSLNAPKWAVGACLTCGSIGIVTRLYAARLSASFRNTRLLLIVVGMLAGLPTLGYGLLLLNYKGDRTFLLIAAFAAYWGLTGLISGITQPTGLSFQNLLFGKGFMRAQGWTASAGRVADILSGLFLIWLLAPGRMEFRRAAGVCFIAAWAVRSFAWLFIGGAKLPESSVSDESGKDNPVGELVGLVMGDRFVRNFVWVTVAARWASDVAAFFLIYAFETGFSRNDIGYYKVVVSATGIIAALLAGRLGKRFGEFGLTRLCYFIWPVGILLLPLFESPWAVYPAAALFTAGSLLSALALTALLMTNAPQGKKTLAATLLILIPTQGTQPMSIFFGFLGDIIGLKWLLALSGLFFVIALRKLTDMEREAIAMRSGGTHDGGEEGVSNCDPGRDCGAGVLPE